MHYFRIEIALSACIAQLMLVSCSKASSQSRDVQIDNSDVNIAGLVIDAGNDEPPTIYASPLKFDRYDVASGMNYSYGFSLADFDGDGLTDMSYTDSWTASRNHFSDEPGADGFIMWSSGEKSQFLSNEIFEYSASKVKHVYLLEKHIPFDVNGDGRLDIVGAVNSHDSIVAYLNPGVKGQIWERRVLTNRTPGALNLVAADVDNDGLTDLFISMRKQGASFPTFSRGVAWLKNPGIDGSEWVYNGIDTSDYLGDTRTLQSGDINQDGWVDVLVSDIETGNVAWYENRQQRWIRHEMKRLRGSAGHFGSLVDFNGDGQLDILMPFDKGITLATNLGEGDKWEYERIVQHNSNWRFEHITEVVVSDLNSDGQLDITYSFGEFQTGGEIIKGGVHWLNFIGGKWNIYAIRESTDRYVGLQVMDFDADGDQDIITNTEHNAHGVSVFINKRVEEIL